MNCESPFNIGEPLPYDYYNVKSKLHVTAHRKCIFEYGNSNYMLTTNPNILRCDGPNKFIHIVCCLYINNSTTILHTAHCDECSRNSIMH